MGILATLLSPSPQKMAPPAPPDMGAVQDARRRQLRLASARRGRESTILTGGQGATGEAPLARKSLLGM